MKNFFFFIEPGGQGRWQLTALLVLLLGLLAGPAAWAQASATEAAPTWQMALALDQLPSNTSDVRGTATDAAGNVYVTGNFTGQVTFGGTVLTSSGSTDVFVARYNSATSTWAWASSGGGSSIDSGNGIATDGTNVYITGQFFGGASFAGQTLTNAGSYDVFVAAYNATTGAGTWATRGGSAGTENSFGIATDGTRVYVTGYFNGSTTSIAGQTLTSAGNADVFVAAYTATTGAGAWATRGGGTSTDQGAGIATDGTRVYVTGNFGSSASIAGQTLTSAGTFTNDMFVAAYTAATGAGAWAIRGGGTDSDAGTGIVVSGTSVYVTGYFASGTSASFAGQALAGAGGNDVFVAAYTTTGTGAWARSGGGTGSDIGFDLATSGTSVHVTGYFASGTNAVFAGQALAGTGTNNNDVFVATYDAGSGVGAGASGGGGSGSDNGYSIAATSTRVYVGGFAALPATFGPITLAGTSPQVGILSVLAPAGSPTLTSLSPSSGPTGTAITLTGINLTGITGVRFNGTAATVFSTGTGTSATVTVPVGTTTGAVIVTTAIGTSNGISFTVTTATAATVATAAATSITATSATLGGNVTADGGATITERGVVYVAGSGTPTTASTKLTATGTTGSYTASATGLTAATLYTVRAYAINSTGTSYGSSQTFTTTPNAPGVTVPANNSLVSTTTPSYAGTGTASSTITVFVDGTSIGTTTASPTSGSWSLNQPTALSQGSHTVQATASIGGSAASGFSNTNTFTVDTVPPSVTLSSTAGASGSGTSTSPLPFTATFSENVTGFVVGDITVSNGTLSGFGGSATTYTFNVTPTGTGAVTVSVPANGAQDAAGNGNTAATPYTLTYAPAPAALTVSTGTLAAPTSIPAGTYTSITVTGTGNAILSGAVSVSTGLTVQSGGSLSTNCQPLTGAGSFTLATSATLYVCDDAGITTSGATGAVQVTGTRSFATDASYVFNGNGAVQSTGNGLPAQVRNLTAANDNSEVSLSQAVRVVQVLTVSGKGDLLLNGKALTLLSDATGTALAVNSSSGGVVNGTATVQRYIDGSLNAGAGYRHLSAPVTNTTVADLATAGFAPEVSQASNYNTSATPGTTTPFPTVFGYDQARLVTASNSNYAAFDKGFFVPAGLGTALTPGQGYAVNIAASQLVDFVGTLGTGDRTLSLARNSGPTAADAGWQLVGNPYPAPLDFSLVAPADRAGLDASMYVFESSSQYAGAYRTYVNGLGGSSLVGSSQGFFVRVSSGNTAGTLTFRNAQRLTSYATQVPVRRGANDLRPQLHLTLAGATGPADALVLYTEAGATAGADPQFDAVKLANPSGLNLATGLASGQELAIDGRPVLTAATVVPLVVGVPAAGSYTFAVAELRNFAPGTRLELVDNLTGTRTPLATGTTYACTLAGFTAPGRFWLALAPAGVLATGTPALAAQVQLYPNPARGAGTLVRPIGSGPASATLLNALGQVVRTLALPTAETRVDLTGLATGVYTLRLTLGGQPITKRLVIE